MTVSVSPRPGDGPLSAKGPTIKLLVKASSLTTFTASILTPDGKYIAVEDALISAGASTIVLTVPPGTPPGSILNVFVEEQDGTVQTYNYELR